MQVSILSERRVFAPYGLNGGSPAKVGQNFWLKQEEGEIENSVKVKTIRKINLGSKASVKMGKGDRILIHTPGGGGWGKVGGEAVLKEGEEGKVVGKEVFSRGDARGSIQDRFDVAHSAS